MAAWSEGWEARPIVITEVQNSVLEKTNEPLDACWGKNILASDPECDQGLTSPRAVVVLNET